MRQRVSDCDAQYSHVLLCHDMQVWSVKIVSCLLRIYGFRTSSQRGLARSSSVARRTAEEAISCARKACRKSQKTSSNHWQNQTKSIRITIRIIQNQFLFIDNFNAFSVHIRRPWTSTRAWWCWMPKRARRRFSSFLHFRVTSLSKAFDAFEYSWSSYNWFNWYWIIVSICLLTSFILSFLTFAEVTLSRTLRSASAYGNASNARRMSQCLQPSGAEVKKEKWWKV